MLSVALLLPLAEDCASKKVSGDICFPIKKGEREKKALVLPTGVRDRDRPQLSPTAPIGWRFVQNPTPTPSLTTHQQILKAYMQPPPSLRRCRTASKPGAQRSTLIHAAIPPLKTAPCAPALALFGLILAARTPFICADFYYLSWRKPSTQRTLQPSRTG